MGYSQEDFCSLDFDFFDLISEESKKIVNTAFKKHMKGQEVEPYEYRLVTKGGDRLDAIINSKLIPYEGDTAILGIVTDITQRKKAEEALLVREQELADKADDLEEMNAALRVLLKKRDDDKTVFEQNIQFNLKQLIEPYLADLQKTQLTSRQETLLKIIKSNMDEIVSSFALKFASVKYKLTAKEIKIAHLIRQGETTKSIANLLGLSSRTIEFHRSNIRNKLGLKDKTENLQSYLLSLT
jgi:PAS domain S-box-containing protein